MIEEWAVGCIAGFGWGLFVGFILGAFFLRSLLLEGEERGD